MPYLQLEDTPYPLLEGDTRVGRGTVADIPLPPAASGDQVDAVITVAIDQTTSIRRATESSVIRVNGVALGSEPSPLLHGDRIEIGGVTLRFGDEAQTGVTTQIVVPPVEHTAAAAVPSPARAPQARSGGRLTSLVEIGRASCRERVCQYV